MKQWGLWGAGLTILLLGWSQVCRLNGLGVLHQQDILSRWIYIGLGLIVWVWLIQTLKAHLTSRERWGWWLLSIGGAANLGERILWGNVADYIFYPGFNLWGNGADILLTIGVGYIGWCWWRERVKT